MLKRTIEISSNPTHLAVRHGQLTLSQNGEIVGSVPCEDIGAVVVDHPQTTYTHAALREIVNHGGSLVICGDDHLPAGILLPVTRHCQLVERMSEQIEASKPRKKRIWQQVIQAKITASSFVLAPSPVAKQLSVLAAQVKSGDTSNVEARAAKLFWRHWLPPRCGFKRDQDGNGFNGSLNYGYAIIRAMLANAILSAGYSPAIGIHHHHRGNPFCLADDLIEPLRPMVDGCVRALRHEGCDGVNRRTKEKLLGLLTRSTKFDTEVGPLNVVVHRYVNRFGRCLRGEEAKMKFPTQVASWN